MKIMNVAGARPNFMKVAPLINAMSRHPGLQLSLINTGQHYDHALSQLFFDELNLPVPDRFLGIGSGSAAQQIGRTMIEFEKVLEEIRPDLVVVVGDVNATIACSLITARNRIKLAHVEAGLRSFDRTMPEEINRLLTDQLADFLFTTEPVARENLLREGIPSNKIHFVGNVMIDTLVKHREQADRSSILADLALSPAGYGLITLHRPGNVDDLPTLKGLLGGLETIQKDVPLVFPMHPRTRSRLESFGLSEMVSRMKGLQIVDPLGYLDFLKLMSNARFVVTDSGGIQEESTILGIPCITARENTERPVTVELGTNEVVGTSPERIVAACQQVIAGKWKKGKMPDLWDGNAAERIVRIILDSP